MKNKFFRTDENLSLSNIENFEEKDIMFSEKLQMIIRVYHPRSVYYEICCLKIIQTEQNIILKEFFKTKKLSDIQYHYPFKKLFSDEMSFAASGGGSMYLWNHKERNPDFDSTDWTRISNKTFEHYLTVRKIEANLPVIDTYIVSTTDLTSFENISDHLLAVGYKPVGKMIVDTVLKDSSTYSEGSMRQSSVSRSLVITKNNSHTKNNNVTTFYQHFLFDNINN